MKNPFVFLLALLIVSVASPLGTFAQEHKHPHMNASGHVLDSAGTKLGWIKNGTIYNAKGEVVGKLENENLLDYKGHKMGKVGKDGSFVDESGKLVFTIESNAKGEACKMFDPQGKVVATVHESYKNQACAIHCLSKKMPPH
jgi:hypothetical protein